MSEFTDETDAVPALDSSVAALVLEEAAQASVAPIVLINFEDPVQVVYCPHCTMPVEYCEYSSLYQEKCLPWITENCPELLEGAAAGGSAKAKKGGVGPKKKTSLIETKIVISKVQRQKKKYITSVIGLDTVPDLKIKDAARVFGKKFSSGASVGDTASGVKEVVIQGDLLFELPNVLINEFKIPPTAIYILDEGAKNPRPYAN